MGGCIPFRQKLLLALSPIGRNSIDQVDVVFKQRRLPDR